MHQCSIFSVQWIAKQLEPKRRLLLLTMSCNSNLHAEPACGHLLISHDPRFVRVKFAACKRSIRYRSACTGLQSKRLSLDQLQHCLHTRLPMQLHALVIQFLTLTRMPSDCCHESKAMPLILCRREQLQPLVPYLTRMQIQNPTNEPE